jgi:hypothetical protein
MKHQLFIIMLWIISLQSVHAECSNEASFWRSKIKSSKSLELFFLENYECKGSFYKSLSSSEKLYFDTVTYPKGLNKEQYKNRWYAISINSDSDFFKRFPTFNNYFNHYKSTITTQQLHCFEKQHGFPKPIPAKDFFGELKHRQMSNDVSYLYPLIRWSYMNSGIDMQLSAKRVAKAKEDFGINVGKVGDKKQFARYLALFYPEYSDISQSLAEKLDLPPFEIYKLLTVLTYLESRGNIFAASTTGAFGPLQLTMHYYMLYGEPNNPFNPKSSLAKLANKFIYYHHIGKRLDNSVIAYKSGTLEKCQDGTNRDVDCRYYYEYKHLMSAMQGIQTKEEVSRYLTGKSYFFPDLFKLKRVKNQNTLKHYEPYQYAVLKGSILKDQAVQSMFLSGRLFDSLGKMRRSDIYKLQKRYGIQNIGVVSDKNVCY